KIAYDDSTTMEMTYWGPDKLDSIKSVKERDDTATYYDYEFGPANEDHYKVTATVKDATGDQRSTSSYEYFWKSKPDGNKWTARLIQTIDGDVTDTEYTPEGSPSAITYGGETTRFKYDKLARRSYKDSSTEVTTWEY